MLHTCAQPEVLVADIVCTMQEAAERAPRFAQQSQTQVTRLD